MKKIIFLIVFCWKSLLSPANTYYISLTGNDENSGLNPSESWLTIDKVNSFSFQPGDSILFMGGETFNGNIDKVTGSGGSNGNPVTFSSYGSGKATISSGELEGIYIGSGDVVIKNLIFQGAGYMATSMWVGGMDFSMDANVTSNFDNISVDNVEVYGYGYWGILFATASPNYSYNHIKVTNCELHDNGFGGLYMSGFWDSATLTTKKTNTDIYFGYNKTYKNLGRFDYKDNWSGSGILISGVTNGVIEHCESYENGSENGSTYAGPVGIFMGESTNIIIQYCKSYNNRGGIGLRDGGGFDIDGGTQNSVIQYCESYENDGAGYGLYHWKTNHPFTNDTIRYNSSYNDGRNSWLYGAITFWGFNSAFRVTNSVIYGNYIKMDKAGTALKFLNNNMTNIQLDDNTFCLTSPAVYSSTIPSNAKVTNSSFPCTVLSLKENSFKVKRVF